MSTTAPHPLMQRLAEQADAQWVSQDTLPDWLQAAGGDAVLVVAGEPVRFPEGLDVAVVLPELRQALGRPFRIGVVEARDQDTIATRYGAQRRPSLIFVRDGRYASTVAGMHDWTDYLALVRDALNHPTGPAPLPIRAEGAAASGCA